MAVPYGFIQNRRAEHRRPFVVPIWGDSEPFGPSSTGEPDAIFNRDRPSWRRWGSTGRRGASSWIVTFDEREVAYGFGELDELVLAYATTIHKSQGSEYPAVVIPLTTQHYAMLARNLLYTGVTRGKQLVVLVGQKKALAIAVKNQGARRRWSKLTEWLRDAPVLADTRRKPQFDVYGGH